MKASIGLSVLLPAALAIIMLGLGLSLKWADFKRVLEFPKAVLVALGCQFLLLPMACVALVLVFNLPAVYAVGMMLLAASPGGTSANLFSHLAGGDVALNITLTAVSSILAIVMMPLIVNTSLAYFMSTDQSVNLQFDKVLQVFGVVLVPVIIGMLIHKRMPAFSHRMEKPVKVFSAVFLIAVVLLVLVTQWSTMMASALEVAAAVLAFNLLSLAVGYGVPRLVNVEPKQATAIGMEIGIHNSTLSITMAMSPALLNNPQMAVPSATYGLLAYFTATAFAAWAKRRMK